MDIKNLRRKVGVMLLSAVLISSMPAYSLSLGKQDEIIIPKNYPAKYNEEYVKRIKNLYKEVSDDHIFYVALDMLKDTNGEFSRRAIMGNNLSKKPVRVMFKDLGSIRPDYADYDALGWKKNKRLYIFINPKHKEAPPGAIAALLSHEAIHQDEYNSIAEETYAWTMEASVWSEILELYPESDENLTVQSNEGYKGLPATSPGFEDL